MTDQQIDFGDKRTHGGRSRSLEQRRSSNQSATGWGWCGGNATAERVDQGRGSISALPYSPVSMPMADYTSHVAVVILYV